MTISNGSGVTLTSAGSIYVKAYYFKSVSGTTGSISSEIPSGAELILGQFGGGADALVSGITNGVPDYSAVRTSGGVVVSTTMDSSGNYTLSGTPSSYPVAIIFAYRVRLYLFNYDKSLGEVEFSGDTGVVSINSESGAITISEGEGIDVSTSSGNIQVSAEDASDTNKGIASFSSSDFVVSSGDVSILDSGVDHGSISGLSDDDHIQYHTDSRALTWLGTRSTSDLSEGTNLYYTNDRVDTQVDSHLSGGDGVTYSSGTITADINNSNLKFTSGEIDTVQDISTSASPQFSGGVYTGAVSGVTPTSTSHLATKGYVDGLVQGLSWSDPVIDKDLSTPPGSPSTNDSYIVGTSPTGAWSGQENNIAKYGGSSWSFEAPQEGEAVWVEDEDKLYVYNGSSWSTFGGTVDHGNLIGLVDDDHPQYHTDGRALTWIGTRSTTDLTEGTNLYYTDERVDDRVSSLIQDGTGISWAYDDGSNTLTPTVSLSPFSTSNLSEGTNLYFTDERVDDRVNSLIQDGTGISWSYNDSGNSLTGSVSLAPFSTSNLSEGTNLYYTSARVQAESVGGDLSGTVASASVTNDSHNHTSSTITLASTDLTDTSSLIYDGDFSSTGLMTRTAANTYTGRTITGTSNQVSVSNGDGVSGDPTLSLPQDIHSGASPTFNGLTATSMALPGFDEGAVVFVGSGGNLSHDVSKLYLDNTNDRLGVGISSPDYTLHLKGPAGTVQMGMTADSGSGRARVGISGGGHGFIDIEDSSGTKNVHLDSDGDGFYNNQFAFGWNTVDSKSRLDVNAGGGAESGIVVQGGYSHGTPDGGWYAELGLAYNEAFGGLKIKTGWSGTAGTPLWVSGSGSSTPALLVSYDNKVGIGTNSPSTKLHIDDGSLDFFFPSAALGSVGAEIRDSDGGHTPALVLNNSGTGGRTYRLASHRSGTTGTFRIRDDSGGFDALTINSSGHMGIGTDSPSYRLHISGDTAAGDGTDGSGYKIKSLSSGYRRVLDLTTGDAVNVGAIGYSADIRSHGSSHLFLDSNGSTEYARLTSTGLGVGIAPTKKLHVDASDCMRLSNSSRGMDFSEVSSTEWKIAQYGTVTDLNLSFDKVIANDINLYTGSPTYAGNITIEKDEPGASVSTELYNTSNTSSSDAKHILRVAGSSGGDPYIGFEVQGVQSWSIGVDNGTDDKFRISPSSAPSSSAVWTMTTSGRTGYNVNSPLAQVHINQNSTTEAIPVLYLVQADADQPFIRFTGSSASDGSKSLSTDTTEDSAKYGAIRVTIGAGGATKWIRLYDDHS